MLTRCKNHGNDGCCLFLLQGWKNVGLLEKTFKVFFRFLGFSVQRRLYTKLQSRKNISYTILSDTSFSVNYNKTHKSRLEYKIKYDLYKIAQKLKT